ncbi:MAG: hypothetical protein WCO29_11755 [Nostocales cyanobacterium ELA583]
MSAKTRWIILIALIGGTYFWYQHEQYKNCINRQMALHLLEPFAFSKSKEVCDRKQLLGD